MKIVICDNEKVYLRKLKKLLEEIYCKKDVKLISIYFLTAGVF